MNSEIRSIRRQDSNAILRLLQQIYPTISLPVLHQRVEAIFQYSNYHCFGYFSEEQLLGICAGWITERLYCGKQLEIDNFIIDETYRSSGIGATLLQYLEQFAQEKQCKTIELNSYVHAGRSHKFYFKNGYTVLGFHFEKKIS